MLENKLQIMKESLEQKLALMSLIEEKSVLQNQMIPNDEVTLAMIDQNMDEKAELIQKIGKLDQGFESLYQDVKDTLKSQKAQHVNLIQEIQNLIQKITEKSVSIEAVEQRNKLAMEDRFRKERKGLQHQRKVSDVAYQYYQTSNGLKNVNPQFMDRKN